MNADRSRRLRLRLLWAAGLLAVLVLASAGTVSIAVIRPLAAGRPVVAHVLGFDLTILVKARGPGAGRQLLVNLSRRVGAGPKADGPAGRPGT
ncbi:hypothetical protein [Tautonia sociabilis]|uniref:Uncharacterized protein n=1 Tax=Tautonia sociabilis TaxID=2080755 RepID=A0A432MJN5_9BACT|nr:hypothetical protein [Tautonia sociabilis]RUL87459.1 hypothetical protein TsocGM_12320 [Tautonia sociabilis]